MRMLWGYVLILPIELFVLGSVAQAQGQSPVVVAPGGQPPTGDISNQVERFASTRQNGVPNRYIVILEDQFSPTARPSGAKGPSVAEVVSDIARLHAATPLRTWDLALPGFLVELPEEAARALSRDPRIRLVEQDAYVEPQNVAPECYQPTIVTHSASFPTSPQLIQCVAPQPDATGCFDNWGLDRIDQERLPRDGLYNFDVATAGVPVHVYLLDTGITAGHQEFLDAAGFSRIEVGVNASVPPSDPKRSDISDCTPNGHGTHVAGILSGTTYGVAKDVRIHPVKITSDCALTRPPISNFVEGINWILANRPAGQPAVANISFNGGDFQLRAMALAATNLVNSGVTLVQSAGNQNQDACKGTMTTQGEKPCDDTSRGPRFPQEIIIAGGVDEYDARWTQYCSPTECPNNPTLCDCGSNLGCAVDIWAPASHIVSSSRRANNAICWLSGTSMAAPHVAGTAALLLSRFPNASPSAVERAITRYGTQDIVTDSKCRRDPPDPIPSAALLYSRFPATGPPVAGDDRFSMSRFSMSSGTPYIDITFAALLAGDFDWDRDPLSIVFPFGTPASGLIQVLSDRVRYTPAPSFTGEITFTYTVSDGHGYTDTASVQIRVPPLAQDDSFTVRHGGRKDLPDSVLLANDSGSLLYFQEIVYPPTHGKVEKDLLGVRYYEPNLDFTGEDTFVYRILDEDTLLMADATVHMTVTASQLYAPTGWVDGFDQQHVWGWACDPDYPTLSNRVDIYTTSGQYLGSTEANQASSDPINSLCRGGSAHYLNFHHNGGIAPGTHFTVWSIDLPYATPGNDNRRIRGNGSIGDGTEFVMPPVCLNNLNLSSQTITTTQVFEACHTITATDFVIGSGGNATLHAVDLVTLGSGFRVSLGGQLKVVVP